MSISSRALPLHPRQVPGVERVAGHGSWHLPIPYAQRNFPIRSSRSIVRDGKKGFGMLLAKVSRDRSMIDRMFQKYLEIDSKYTERKPSLGHVCVCVCVRAQCHDFMQRSRHFNSTRSIFWAIFLTLSPGVSWKPHRLSSSLASELSATFDVQKWHIISGKRAATSENVQPVDHVLIIYLFIQGSIPWPCRAFGLTGSIYDALPLRFWLFSPNYLEQMHGFHQRSQVHIGQPPNEETGSEDECWAHWDHGHVLTTTWVESCCRYKLDGSGINLPNLHGKKSITYWPIGSQYDSDNVAHSILNSLKLVPLPFPKALLLFLLNQWIPSSTCTSGYVHVPKKRLSIGE